MNRAKLFKNGESQAVRLPKEYRFNGKEVYIRKVGDSVILTSVDDAVDRFWSNLENFTEDLKIERNQPSGFDIRESL